MALRQGAKQERVLPASIIRKVRRRPAQHLFTTIAEHPLRRRIPN